MSSSHSFLLVHLVFGTKNREPVLDGSVRPALHAYLASVARNIGCECFRVGGVADHVHMALRLTRTMTTAKLVEELKTSSSKWLKTQSPTLANFSWQLGFGAFSVGRRDLDALCRYIDNQESHHADRAFPEELRGLLTRHGITFDERFLLE